MLRYITTCGSLGIYQKELGLRSNAHWAQTERRYINNQSQASTVKEQRYMNKITRSSLEIMENWHMNSRLDYETVSAKQVSLLNPCCDTLSP